MVQLYVDSKELIICLLRYIFEGLNFILGVILCNGNSTMEYTVPSI